MMAGQFIGARAGSRLVLSKAVADPADDRHRLGGDERETSLRQPRGGDFAVVGNSLMQQQHHYQQLIDLFDSCFAEDFNTR